MFIPLKRNPDLLAVPPHFPPSAQSPWQPVVYVLPLQICQFWIFHRNEIIQHGVLCAWRGSLSGVFSGLTRVVAGVSAAPLLRATARSTAQSCHVSLFRRQWVGVWVASTVWLLWIRKGCCEQILGGRMFLILLCKYLGVELHGHMVSLHTFLPISATCQGSCHYPCLAEKEAKC